jgi:EAL domain-containing protein (putative c-di-GMP-specific phosphodiesterase class I)
VTPDAPPELGTVQESAGNAALLRGISARLEPHLGRLVEDFYAELGREPHIREVVDRLTPDQFEHLKRRQGDHLRMLLSPYLDRRVLHERSRQVGHVHAMVGVELAWYVDALGLHRRHLMQLLEQHASDLDLVGAQAAMSGRFSQDLQGALIGYRDLDDAQNRVMLRVIDVVAESRTVADLVRGVVDALGGLDGMAVCLFARQGPDQQMSYEIGSGPGFLPFITAAAAGEYAPVTTIASAQTGQGPIGRAWRTGQVQRCDSLLTDPTAEPWRDIARQLGWGSSAAMPLVGPDGRSRALVSLQSSWAGYFAGAGRQALLEQVKRVTERALVELEEQPSLATGVSGYQHRTAHLALLAAGEVTMLFQPVVELPSGRLRRLEALARLNGSERLLSPAEFLPAFGDDELFALFDIGLNQSLSALHEWERSGLVTGVSVNLPVAGVDDDRYVRLVAHQLAAYGIAPHRLTLELLETGFADREMERRRRAIDDLKDLGVRLAQDDLGSGYSSLLRLRHFAFDDVKIDQSLVRGTGAEPTSALHFIKPINAIAHSMGLSVVIEGLEHDGLIEAAVQLGSDEGQGYGIARPMPAEAVLGWAAGYRLDADPSQPRTPLGALAGHVAWEHWASAVADLPAQVDLPSILHRDGCSTTAYVRHVGDPVLAALHERLHVASGADRGSAEHRAAWSALVTAVLAR